LFISGLATKVRNRRTMQATRRVQKKLAPKDAVLVFEDVQMQQPEKRVTRGVALRRRLSLWQHDAIRQATIAKAEMAGAEMAGAEMAYVNPAYTNKNCSRCGLRGVRTRHRFRCPHCGQAMHADVNAAINIRNRFVQSRLDGPPSVGPVA